MVDIADELEKLARLHESGALTDEEFARAKKAAIGREVARPVEPAEMDDATLGKAANRYVTFQIIMALLALVVFVVVFVLVFLPRLNAFPRP